MKSIQSKIILLITSALLTLALFMGGFAIWNTSQLVEHDSTAMINAVCMEQAVALDNRLERIEQSVTTIYNYAEDELASAKDIENPKFREEYTEKILHLALDISNNTEGAIAVYFHYAPELTNDGTSGIFWSRIEQDGEFVSLDPTDLNVYDEDDVEHVGWYYEPVKAGKPIWMSPYFNQNIGIQMISYVIPFYKDGTLIGVIGMDIDFTLFVDVAQDAAVYKSGSANLIDMSTKYIYYRNPGDDEITIRSAEVTDTLYNDLLAAESSGDILYEYPFNGVEYKMAFQPVRNGMKYVLYSPTKEINEKKNDLILTILFMTAGIVALFVIFTIFMAKKITNPLKELTKATEKMAKGDLDVVIAIDSKDEIGILTEGINSMAGELKEYMGQINAAAYKDALTGVKNKNCYLDYIKTLDSSDEEYAIVLFDINDLKILNDNYGHEVGDELIVLASKFIKNIFSDSDIFRIGGDEFVGILKSSDFAKREELMEQFAKEMSSNRLDVKPFTVLSIASGIEVCGKGMTFDDVFRKADEMMYQNKTEYYRTRGVDRRGQAAAHTALCNLYTKILKINLTKDAYSIVNMDEKEQTVDKGFNEKISAWLSEFGKSGQVHPDDLSEYLKKTNIEFLKEYFKNNKTSINIHYRRKYNDGFKQVEMEIILADDYTVDNQSLFLYVKPVDL